MRAHPTAPVPRIALTRAEAAASLGVSLSHFERHIAPGLRTIRTGSARLIPTAELIAWADRSATLAGDATLVPGTKAPGRRANAPRHGHEEQAP